MQEVSLELILDDLRAQKYMPRVHSSDVEPGDAFVVLPPTVQGAAKCRADEDCRMRQSYPGNAFGGDHYLPEAIKAMAGCIVCGAEHLTLVRFLHDSLTPEKPLRVVVVADPRDAIGRMAGAYYGTENASPQLIGLTGTNGKTTTSYLLEHIFTALGRKVGVMGTVNYRWPGVSRDALLTTPSCLELHKNLAQMHEAGVDTAIMEISSHALEQGRVAGLKFQAALFSNLTQDHLDYHGTMENYYEAKAILFKTPSAGGVPDTDKTRVINADDPYGRRLLADCAADFARIPIGYTLKEAKAPGVRVLEAKIMENSRQGLNMECRFEGKAWNLATPLIGEFNAYNVLGALGVALGLGLSPEKTNSLESFSGVPGRMERVCRSSGFNIFVDYAHTPDALESVLSTLKNSGFERIVTVFGCGGNRDRAKRPLMGRAVARFSDVAILTSDNPRHETPEKIMEDVLPGLRDCKEAHSLVNRRDAIAKGLELIGPKDALLIAGKGHESYQQIGAQKIPYSDQAVVRELLRCV